MVRKSGAHPSFRWRWLEKSSRRAMSMNILAPVQNSQSLKLTLRTIQYAATIRESISTWRMAYDCYKPSDESCWNMSLKLGQSWRPIDQISWFDHCGVCAAGFTRYDHSLFHPENFDDSDSRLWWLVTNCCRREFCWILGWLLVINCRVHLWLIVHVMTELNYITTLLALRSPYHYELLNKTPNNRTLCASLVGKN